MARRNYDVTELAALNGGIDLDSNPFEVPGGCLINCNNVLPSLSVGGIQVINGNILQNPNSQIVEAAVAVPINGLISFYNQSGVTEFFVAQAGSDIWNNSPEGKWSTITGSLTFTNAQDNLASMAVLNNILYGVNRSEDQFWQWSLSGNATVVPISGLYTIAVNGGGTGYVVGDVLTVTGGSGSGGTITVAGISGGGVINSLTITTPGKNYVVTTSAATTGGMGSGATIAINAVTPQINGNFLVNFNNTIFVNGGSALPKVLYYSDLNVGNNFNPVNFLTFDTGKGNYLTGAVNALFGNLFVFKNKSIHLVSPTGSIPSYSNNLYIDGIGCISHQSIVTLPGGEIMFWDTDDIYRIIGTQVESATIHPKTGRPRLRNFFRNNVNIGRLNKVCGVYYDALDCVFWFYSSSSSDSNDSCLAYHVKTQSFWLLGLRGTSCAVRVISNQSKFFTGNTDGYIYQQDNGQSLNGASIPWSFQIPWQDLGDLLRRKKGDLVYAVLYQQSNFNVLCDVYLNQSLTAYSSNNILATLGVTQSGGQFSNSADTNIFDTATFATPSSGLMEGSFLINTLFKTISLNFHGSNINQPLTIHRIAITSRELELSRLTD